jgi:glycosyltransferase involved in cell wall biosynthesis
MACDGQPHLRLGPPQGMNTYPKVSVVMSVYNGASHLAATLDSILSQEGVELEFIVVNDGSRDKSAQILGEYAQRDSRLRIIHQENTGLTRALIRGCDSAQGEFIARQDAGDISLPGRLACQRVILDADPAGVLVSCATRFVGPSDEELYTVAQSSEELEEGLRQLTIEKVRGPSHHGSTMFRRSTYEQVGGYRAAFPIAQDLDLWMRVSEVGRCFAMPEMLYQAKWAPGAISATRRDEQLRATHSIVACAAARRAGRDEAEDLSRWQSELAGLRARAAGGRGRSTDREHARFYYFIARTLRRHRPDLSRLYYWKSIRSWVLYPRAWAGLITDIFLLIRARSSGP